MINKTVELRRLQAEALMNALWATYHNSDWRRLEPKLGATPQEQIEKPVFFIPKAKPFVSKRGADKPMYLPITIDECRPLSITKHCITITLNDFLCFKRDLYHADEGLFDLLEAFLKKPTYSTVFSAGVKRRFTVQKSPRVSNELAELALWLLKLCDVPSYDRVFVKNHTIADENAERRRDVLQLRATPIYSG